MKHSYEEIKLIRDGLAILAKNHVRNGKRTAGEVREKHRDAYKAIAKLDARLINEARTRAGMPELAELEDIDKLVQNGFDNACAPQIED